MAKLKGQSSRKVYWVTFDFDNSNNAPLSSSIEEEILVLHAEVEGGKTITNSIGKSSSSTCFLTIISKNSNSSFCASKTICEDS